MRRRLETAFDAPARDVATAATALLDVAPGPDGVLVGALAGTTNLELRITIEHDPGDEAGPPAASTRAILEAGSDEHVPGFGWFVDGLRHLEARRELRYTERRIRAVLADAPAPDPPRRLSIFPPVAFTPDQVSRIAAICVVAAAASFCGALFTQNGDAVTETFGKSDRALGGALAIARIGVLVSLVAAALADRFGRRRVLLTCVVGAALSNAVTAGAWSFEVFTLAQLFTRAFVNAVLVIAGLAVVEEAPEEGRAFALSMFGLAFGFGFAFSVILLPLTDLGDESWRIAFGLSAFIALLVPGLRRRLRETARYHQLETRHTTRGRFREVFDRRYGRRFLLLGTVAFLTNVFSAPSSQLQNRYLRREHDYSNSEVALFRSVTAGVPGFLGVMIGGRLSESRGRRPVTIAGLVIAAAFQMSFFLTGGVMLWITPTIAIVAALAAGLALGALDTELFPTEVRGTSSGFLLVCGVLGSAAGLVLATSIEGAVGGLGPAIAICGVAPLVAAILVVPRLPETAERRLDDISPSEQ